MYRVGSWYAYIVSRDAYVMMGCVSFLLYSEVAGVERGGRKFSFTTDPNGALLMIALILGARVCRTPKHFDLSKSESMYHPGMGREANFRLECIHKTKFKDSKSEAA